MDRMIVIKRHLPDDYKLEFAEKHFDVSSKINLICFCFVVRKQHANEAFQDEFDDK